MRVLAEVEAEAQRVDGVAVVHVELTDDVGLVAAVVAVAVVGDQAHAPLVRHAAELDVEAPAEADVAVRALDDDAVGEAVLAGGGRVLCAGEDVEGAKGESPRKESGVLPRTRLSRASMVAWTLMVLVMWSVGSMRKRMLALPKPLWRPQRRPALTKLTPWAMRAP